MFLIAFPRKSARAESIKDINAFIRLEDFCKARTIVILPSLFNSSRN